MRPTRRDALAVLSAWAAAGCAGPGEAPAPAAPVRPQGTGLLTPWMDLTGGWRDDARPPNPLQPPRLPAPPGRIQLMRPVAVAAHAGALWIADAGLRQLLRLQRAQDRIAPLLDIGGDTQLALHAVADGSVWLAEPASRLVRQVDPFGRVVRSLRDDHFAASPVGVVALRNGDVCVADAATASLAVFDGFGRVQRRLGTGRLQSVAGLAAGPLGLYAVDRLAQQVLVFGEDGRLLRLLGGEGLVMPRALAVDAAGRVFVGDDGDLAVHVFLDDERIARFGGAGAGPGRFGQVDALAVDESLLYVADALQARVRVMLVSPESLRRPRTS